jgi:hypothetical protein
MNIDNLNRLIELFESLPDEKVNLDRWRTVDYTQCTLEYYVTDDLLVNDCGTCGCIVGWLPVLTGVPVSKYSYVQLADFLNIPCKLAYDIEEHEMEIWLSHKVIAINRLKELLK